MLVRVLCLFAVLAACGAQGHTRKRFESDAIVPIPLDSNQVPSVTAKQLSLLQLDSKQRRTGFLGETVGAVAGGALAGAAVGALAGASGSGQQPQACLYAYCTPAELNGGRSVGPKNDTNFKPDPKRRHSKFLTDPVVYKRRMRYKRGMDVELAANNVNSDSDLKYYEMGFYHGSMHLPFGIGFDSNFGIKPGLQGEADSPPPPPPPFANAPVVSPSQMQPPDSNSRPSSSDPLASSGSSASAPSWMANTPYKEANGFKVWAPETPYYTPPFPLVAQQPYWKGQETKNSVPPSP
eukprot:GILK01001536.1.p1 GENE.GILK01001536.1~~GILK01001536.1.p1  ORF type:complete len:294 (-),score=34.03 GILK01001536.1:205-1086(-)